MPPTSRLVELDLARTIAIVLMVVYHLAFDLHIFHGWSIDLHSPFWEALRLITVSLFLLTSGFASQLSKRPLHRASIVLGCAGVVSAASYLHDPTTWIYWGILHCIGLGWLVLRVLKPLRELKLLLGFALTLIPAPAAPLPTLDFYPPLPWIGFMVIGAGLGHLLFTRLGYQGQLRGQLWHMLTLPGRQALVLYLIHQPILLVTLHLTLS